MKKNLICSLLFLTLPHFVSAETLIGTVDMVKLKPLMLQWVDRDLHADTQLTSEYTAVKKDAELMTNRIKQPQKTEAEKASVTTELNTLRDKIGKETLTMSKHLFDVRLKSQTHFQELFANWVQEIAKEQHLTMVIPKHVMLYTDGTRDLTDALKLKIEREFNKAR